MQAIGPSAPARPRELFPVIALGLIAVIVGLSAATLGPLGLMPVFGSLFLALVLTRPQYGIALFLSTFLMAYPASLQGVGYLTINNVLGGIFGIMLIYKVYRDADWWFIRTPEIQLLVFVSFAYFLSNELNAPDPHMVSLLGPGFYFAEGLRTFVNRVAFTLFFIVYIRTPAHLRMVYLLAVGFMVFTALTGVQGVLGGGGLKGYRAYTGSTELVAGKAGIIRAAGNPNRLAMFAILAISGMWYLSQYLRIPGVRYVSILTISVLSLAVFMTASRSGLLGLITCALAIVIDEGVEIRRLLSFALAGALVVILVVQFVPSKSLERITNLPGTEGAQTGVGSASLERRQYIWELAAEMFRENPVLGVGMGNWATWRFIKDPGYSTGQPHNSYVLTLIEGGIFALGGFLALLWRTWRNLRFAEAYVSVPGSPLADLSWIVKSAKVSLVVLIFFSMFADLWNLVIIFMLIGTSVVVRRLVEDSQARQAVAY